MVQILTVWFRKLNKQHFMKRQYLLLCFAFIISLGNYFEAYSQGGAIGFHATLAEYDGDVNGNKHHFYQFDKAKLGGAISFQQYISPSFNLMEKVSFNSMTFQNEARTAGISADIFTANIKLRYKFNNGYLFKEDAAIAPFLMGGIGAAYINSKKNTELSKAIISDGTYRTNVAFGAGVLFQLTDRVGLELANTINIPMYDGWDGVTSGKNDIYLQHSAGLIFNLRKAKDEDGDGVPDKKDDCLGTIKTAVVDNRGCPVDTDQDGVPDYQDACPNIKGLNQFNGCPDTDKDGIADKDDTCPDVPGIARFSGCPDSDGDGVADSEDACPNLKGLDIFKGCPDTDGDGVEDSKDKCAGTVKGSKVDATGCIPDSDQDGINDAEDECPLIAGILANKGCPEIKVAVKQLFQKALQGIQFESGKAVIKKVSYPIMDAIVNVMKENPNYKLVIGGHTDSQGDDLANMTLSKNRADAVANYLITAAISPLRISSSGFGESIPVDTNDTAAGRMRNRRVEFKVEFLK